MPDISIAGELDLVEVMSHLANTRPAFHSEADFQFAFAQTAVALSPDLQCRLEIPVPPSASAPGTTRAEYLDLSCSGASGQTLIEFKYATRAWSGTIGGAEDYQLRNHAAYDLTRRYFANDIRRLERFVGERPEANGVAILLTNEPSLWLKAAQGRRLTRFENFRIHDGRSLSGLLEWGFGDAKEYDVNLTGQYQVGWRDYSRLPAPGSNKFRWLALEVPRHRGARQTDLPR